MKQPNGSSWYAFLQVAPRFWMVGLICIFEYLVEMTLNSRVHGGFWFQQSVQQAWSVLPDERICGFGIGRVPHAFDGWAKNLKKHVLWDNESSWSHSQTFTATAFQVPMFSMWNRFSSTLYSSFSYCAMVCESDQCAQRDDLRFQDLCILWCTDWLWSSGCLFFFI